MIEETFAIISRLGANFTSKNQVIYLGEWCLPYEREFSPKHKPKIIEYHWNDREKAEADFALSWDTYLLVLEKLVPILNKKHRKNQKIEFWELILGSWLLSWIGVVLDRLRGLEQLNQEGPNITILKFGNEIDRSPYSEEDYFEKLNKNDDWNELLISDISEYFEGLSIRAHQEQEKKLTKNESQLYSRNGKFRIVVSLINSLHRITYFRFAKYYFEKSYLRKWPLAIINLRIRQIPTFIESSELSFQKVDTNLRDFEIKEESDDLFLKIVLELLPKYIPTPFLEGFATLDQIAETNKRPQKPKVIFTANAFSADTEWKVWAAKKCQEGSTLIISQHGGHYGVNKYSANESLERRLGDYYFTWGWARFQDNSIIPAPATKLMGIRKRSRATNQTSILLISGAAHPRTNWIASMPLGPQVSQSVEMNFEFFENLNAQIASKVKLRYYPQEYGIYEKKRWMNKRPDVTFSDPEDNFETEIQAARLVVVNYNATTLLEAIIRNIPTVMYWDFNHWELSPESECDFQDLIRMKILFPSAELCAKHINTIWPDVDNWWYQPERKAAIESFRHKYAYVGPKPYKEFASLLKKCSSI